MLVHSPDTRLRIRQFAAARQFQKQECAGAFEADAIAANDTAALTHCSPGRAVDIMPEALDRRMRSAPFGLECLDFLIGKPVRLKFPPSAEPTHVTEREITCLAGGPLRRAFGVGAGRNAENLARSFAVNFIPRVVRGVIATVRIKLPRFASDPGQDAAFDAREIGADQYVSGRRADH